ncbi:benzoate-CoA ligase family protein [Streptomyces sp. NPDC047072]|uniref:benzoate-CoA ligase family protein n=1 Tax=Streptomyces sp. NPDC047072 TaxID=3154809 RepID=UPI0033E9F527
MPELFNAADWLVDRHVREGNGDRTAVVTPTRSLTYAELAAEVRRAASGLRGLGVRPEERVLFCMPDDIELFAGVLAAFRVGAVAVPASTMLTGGELGKLVADCRTKVVVGSGEFAPVVKAAVREAPEVTHLVPGPLPDSGAADEPYPTWPDSPALWLYTSGTTGTPKAAMHRHADIRFVAETYGRQVLGLAPGDRCLSVAKLFFAYGLGNSMFFPLAVGATALLEPARPSPALFAKRAAADRATVLFGVPGFLGALLAAPDIPDDAFASVRLGVSAGETLPARIYQGVLERFGVEVLDGIGSTEMLHIFVSNRAGRVHPGSSGAPVPGYAVQLRDTEGRLVTEAGTPGELHVRGESAATGYWCRAKTTRQVFLGDWVRTGDTYVRNADGTYTCLGRTDDLLKAGGIWVAPAEVEERLLAHPDVAEAAVVGAPDRDGLDKPVACVVPRPGREVDPDALVAWCREGLAAFKRPRGVIGLPELPRTPTGKIRRNVLRAMIRDGSWAPKSPS